MIKDRRGKQITIERCGGQRKEQWTEVSKMVRERRGGEGRRERGVVDRRGG